MGKILLTLATILGVCAAQAKEGPTTPLWTCKMEVKNAKGRLFAFGLGASSIKGKGTLTCAKPNGKTYTAPIKMEVGRLGVGVGNVEITGLNMRTFNVGISDPKQLFGEYSFGSGVDITFATLNTGISSTFGLDNGLDVEMEVYGAKARDPIFHTPTVAILVGGLAIRVVQDKSKIVEDNWLD